MGSPTVGHHHQPIKHARDLELGWDLGFLAFGALLVAVGVALARSGERVVRTQTTATR